MEFRSREFRSSDKCNRFCHPEERRIPRWDYAKTLCEIAFGPLRAANTFLHYVQNDTMRTGYRLNS